MSGLPVYLLGRVVLDMNEKEQLFKQAAALNPKFPWPLYGLGHRYERLQKWPESEENFRKAIALEPATWRAESHHAFGFCLMQQGKDKEAEAEYNEALKCDPGHVDSFINMSLIELRRNNPEAAIRYCEKALELDEDNPWARNNLGKAYFAQKRCTSALKQFQAALENPRYDTPELAYLNMGFVYHRQGKLEQAADAFSPDVASGAYAHNCLAHTLYDLKKYEEAWERARKAQELGYTVPEAFLKALDAARTGKDTE